METQGFIHRKRNQKRNRTGAWNWELWKLNRENRNSGKHEMS